MAKAKREATTAARKTTKRKKKPAKLDAEPGTFAVTGGSPALARGRGMKADTGTFAATGGTPTLWHRRPVKPRRKRARPQGDPIMRLVNQCYPNNSWADVTTGVVKSAITELARRTNPKAHFAYSTVNRTLDRE